MAFESGQDYGEKQQGVEVGGDRIAGQAQDHPSVEQSRQHGFPGLQPDAVEEDLGTRLVEYLGQIVPFSHGDSAGRHQHLRGSEFSQESLDGTRIIRERGENAGFSP
jgi:hypothetical protein